MFFFGANDQFARPVFLCVLKHQINIMANEEKKVQIYLHGENTQESKLTDVPENATAEEIVIIYKGLFGQPTAVEEIFIFHENSEHLSHAHGPHQFHHRKHVHAHRCKTVIVRVSYNGVVKTIKASPATTGSVLLEKAADAFGINPVDAANLLLRLADNRDIQTTDHLGSFVSHKDCTAVISLVPNPQIKG